MKNDSGSSSSKHTSKRRKKTKDTEPVDEETNDTIASYLAEADALLKVEYNELCDEVVASSSRKRRSKGMHLRLLRSLCNNYFALLQV